MAIYPPYKVRKAFNLTEYQDGEIKIINFPIINNVLGLDLTETQTGEVLSTILLNLDTTETQTGNFNIQNVQLLDLTETQTGNVAFIDNFVVSLDTTETQTGDLLFNILLVGLDATETQTGGLDIRDVVILPGLDTTQIQSSDVVLGTPTLSLDTSQTQAGDIIITGNSILSLDTTQTQTGDVTFTSQLNSFTPVEGESGYVYFNASNAFAQMFDGNTTTSSGMIKTTGGTPNVFIAHITFTTTVTLTRIDVWTGQFNGAFNQPTGLNVYAGLLSNASAVAATPLASFTLTTGTTARQTLNFGTAYTGTQITLRFTAPVATISILECQFVGST